MGKMIQYQNINHKSRQLTQHNTRELPAVSPGAILEIFKRWNKIILLVEQTRHRKQIRYLSTEASIQITFPKHSTQALSISSESKTKWKVKRENLLQSESLENVFQGNFFARFLFPMLSMVRTIHLLLIISHWYYFNGVSRNVQVQRKGKVLFLLF